MSIHNTNELGRIIKSYRLKQGLKQNKMSELTGLRQATISQFENSPGKSKIETLFRILDACDLRLSIESTNQSNKQTGWQEEW